MEKCKVLNFSMIKNRAKAIIKQNNVYLAQQKPI